MRTLAVGLLLFAAVVYLADPRPRRLPGLRQRRRRGVDGGRDRRLVRGHRPVQAPARPADPAHRADPQAQGRPRPQPGGVLRGELPPGGDHPRAGRRGRTISRRVGEWARRSPTTRAGWSTRSPRSRASRWPRWGTEQIAELVETVLVPRFREEPIAPLLGTFVDRGGARRPPPRRGRPRRWRSCTAGWSRTPTRSREVLSERAPWWAPTAAQRRGHDPDPHRDGALGRRHPRGPAPPRPRGARLDAGPARPGPAVRPRHPGARRGGSRTGCSTTRSSRRPASRCGTRCARRCSAALRDPSGELRRRLQAELVAFAERLTVDEDAAAAARRGRRRRGGLRRRAVRRRADHRHHAPPSSAGTARRPPDRIELHVGRDLQFIRINGTIVGGLVGVLIHTVAVLLMSAPVRRTRSATSRSGSASSSSWPTWSRAAPTPSRSSSRGWCGSTARWRPAAAGSSGSGDVVELGGGRARVADEARSATTCPGDCT